MSKYRCPYCNKIHEENDEYKGSETCFHCDREFLKPNNLKMAERVKEEKYPGAWKLDPKSNNHVIGGDSIGNSWFFDSKKAAAEIVTGSRLLKHALSIRHWWGEKISEILADHEKMLKEVNDE